MAVGRLRVRIVLDTNVLVAAYLSRSAQSANLRVLRMWAERRLQLILSEEIRSEFLAVLARLGVSSTYLRALDRRLVTRATVTTVRPSKKISLSRDPSDNALLAAAVTGKAKFVVTNDADLLQIPPRMLKPFRFRIVTPREFLRAIQDRE